MIRRAEGNPHIPVFQPIARNTALSQICLECFALRYTFGEARRSCTQYVDGCSGEFPQMMRNFSANARRMKSAAGICYNRLHCDAISVIMCFKRI